MGYIVSVWSDPDGRFDPIAETIFLQGQPTYNTMCGIAIYMYIALG